MEDGKKTDVLYNPLPGDSYDTPENTPVGILDYLLLRSRWSFYLRNFYVFCKSGYYAKHTEFGRDAQTLQSYHNFQIVERCGGRIHLRGMNNITDVEGPVVFIGNHMSLLETAVLHAFVCPRKKICFVIKEQLLHVPFFGDIMRKLGCIAVGRANPREDLRHVMEEGKKQIENGTSVIIFPQSSRSSVFRTSHFNTIGVKLAKHANVPVIPVALRTDFLGNGKLIKDLGPVFRNRPVWFSFGKALKVEGNGKETHQKIIDFIIGNLKEWGCQVEDDSSEGTKKNE